MNEVFHRSLYGMTHVTVEIRDLEQVLDERHYSQRDVASIVTREVCSDCNQGWMSRLEETTKPHLLPMLTGLEKKLSEVEQLAVATWAVKTVMVLEVCIGNARTFTYSERQFVKQQGFPPATTLVYASVYSGEKGPLGYYFGGAQARDDYHEFSLHTLLMGRLILHVYRFYPEAEAFTSIPSKWLGSIPVYPPIPNWSWPWTNVQEFDDDLLEEFTTGKWFLCFNS